MLRIYIHVKHGNLSSTLEKFKGISKYFDNVEHPFVQKRQSRKVDMLENTKLNITSKVVIFAQTCNMRVTLYKFY